MKKSSDIVDPRSVKMVRVAFSLLAGRAFSVPGITLLMFLMCVSVRVPAAAQSVHVDSLGTPVRALNVLAGIVTRNRHGAGDLLVVTNTDEVNGGELIFINYEKNTSEQYRFPSGKGAWGLTEVAGDRLIVGTYYDAAFLVFDLNTMKFVKEVAVPGEQYLWGILTAGDGAVYGGTYPGGKLVRFDPDTYDIKDFGNPAPPNQYLRPLWKLDDNRLLATFGTAKPVTKIFDIATKTFSDQPEPFKGIQWGTPWKNYYIAGKWAYDRKSLKKLSGIPDEFKAGSKSIPILIPGISSSQAMYYQQNDTIFMSVPGKSGIEPFATAKLMGGELWGVDHAGRIIGMRGQSYFTVEKGRSEATFTKLDIVSSPRDFFFLRYDGAGRLWSGSSFGQTLFYLDTKSLRASNTDMVSRITGGEVYDIAPSSRGIYAVSYSRGEIIWYDPDKPWNIRDGVNPVAVATLYDSGLVRPLGGIVDGPDEKLYSGWLAKYGQFGGGIAVTDPTKGTTEIIREPFREQGVSALAVSEAKIYFGTTIQVNGLPDRTDRTGQFGVLDLARRKREYLFEFPKTHAVRKIVSMEPFGLIGCLLDYTMRMYSIGEKRILDEKEYPTTVITSRSVSFDNRSTLYFGRDSILCALDVPSKKQRHVAALPSRIDYVELAGDALFVTCGPRLYRLTNFETSGR